MQAYVTPNGDIFFPDFFMLNMGGKNVLLTSRVPDGLPDTIQILNLNTTAVIPQGQPVYRSSLPPSLLPPPPPTPPPTPPQLLLPSSLPGDDRPSPELPGSGLERHHDTGRIVGTAVGVAVGSCVLVGLVAWWILRRRAVLVANGRRDRVHDVGSGPSHGVVKLHEDAQADDVCIHAPPRCLAADDTARPSRDSDSSGGRNGQQGSSNTVAAVNNITTVGGESVEIYITDTGPDGKATATKSHAPPTPPAATATDNADKRTGVDGDGTSAGGFGAEDGTVVGSSGDASAVPQGQGQGQQPLMVSEVQQTLGELAQAFPLHITGQLGKGAYGMVYKGECVSAQTTEVVLVAAAGAQVGPS